ncbi:MAG: ribosome biogenesis GTP-binding protein YihA/YsxC [Candidatus Ozemobacteraceae bacterium]
MTLKITAAQFSACVVGKDAMPTDGKPVFALIGRSNVGKSSLINLLCARREMAKTSSTPGKTLTLNYYLINDSFYIVDLPGYGYAKANKVTRDRVQQMVDEFFSNSTTLAAIFHIIDVRHPPSAMDIQMNIWIREQEFRYLPILTKTDKVAQGELVRNIKSITKKLETPFALAFSAKSGHGKEDLLNAIEQMLTGGDVAAGSGARGGHRRGHDRQGNRPSSVNQGRDRDRGDRSSRREPSVVQQVNATERQEPIGDQQGNPVERQEPRENQEPRGQRENKEPRPQRARGPRPEGRPGPRPQREGAGNQPGRGRQGPRGQGSQTNTPAGARPVGNQGSPDQSSLSGSTGSPTPPETSGTPGTVKAPTSSSSTTLPPIQPAPGAQGPENVSQSSSQDRHRRRRHHPRRGGGDSGGNKGGPPPAPAS